MADTMQHHQTYSEAELTALLADSESDLVERKAAFTGDAPNAIRQAICAFANDVPGHGRPGVIFIGVQDDGAPSGIEINDALLLRLAQCRSDGNILPLPDIVRDLDSTLRAHVRTSVEIGTRTTELRRASYALPALQELVRNAVMHRAYEATHTPIHVSWFANRVEIISPGGPFGDVSVANFGQPGIVSYRNPNLADAMRVSGLVQRYGVGIPLARQALRENQQSEPVFEVDASRVRCTVGGNSGRLAPAPEELRLRRLPASDLSGSANIWC